MGWNSNKSGFLCGLFNPVVVGLIFITTFMLLPELVQAKSRNILILHSYHKGLSWTDNLHQGIIDGLGDHPELEIYTEYLDTKRHASIEQLEASAAYLKQKYADIPLDAIVVSDNNALAFATERRQSLFEDLPLIFTGINNFSDDLIRGQDKITGVVEETDSFETVRIALNLHPDARTVHVVHDQTSTSIAESKKLKAQLTGKFAGKEFRYHTNSSTTDLLKTLGRIPASDIVLLILWNKDADGNYFSYEESADRITKASAAPVYGLWDFYLDHGVVGGKLVSARAQGLVVAKIIRRLVTGEPVASIPIERKSPNRLLFDFRKLAHFDIDRASLPEGSAVLFDPVHHDPTKQGARSAYKIGVLAKRGEQKCLEQWQATADYLSRQIPGSVFQIEPLDFNELRKAAANASIDFVLTNSSYYIELEIAYKANRIATMINKLGDIHSVQFGGVLFTRAENSPVHTLQDLPGRSFMAVDESSFGGWLAARKVLEDAGMNPYEDLRSLQFAGTHDAVVDAVLNGRVDAGTVRTDTLERMALEGKIRMEDVRIIHARKQEGFPYVLSTELYPEWPFAAMPHVPVKVASRVSAALLNMDENCEAAMKAKDAGWTAPLPYESVRLTMQQLRYGPFENFGKITLAQFVQQHWMSGLLGVALFVVLILFSAWAAVSKRTVKQAALNLRKSREQFLLAVNGSQDGIWDWDLLDNSLFLSEKWKHMLGYRDDELPNVFSSFADNVHPDDMPGVQANLEKYLNGELGHYSVEFRMKHKDGHDVDILARGEAIRDEDGKPVRMAGSHTDITERKRAEKALSEKEARLSAIMDSVQAGVVLVEAETGRITEVNNKAAEMIDEQKENIVGRICHQYICPAETGKCPVRDFGHSIDNSERELLTKSKGRIPILKTVNRIELEGKSFLLESFVDISVQKRSERDLIDTNRQLEEITTHAREMAVHAEAANIAKSQFLANMSHEIRTPMNAVVGMSDLLLDMELSDRQREYVAVISKSADSLLALINDILDYSKIEADKLDIEDISFDLRTLLEDVGDVIAIRAHEKALEFVCFLPPDIPTRLIGDPTRLRQIITNLANNAVKFTEKGEVSIKAAIVESGENDALIRFEVKDTGIGLSSKAMEKLFQPFTQADASTTRQFGGTGLGLSISKRLSEMMGGEIGVESKEGEGSRFWFTARLRRQSDSDAPDIPALPGDIRNVRILAVDDNESNRMVVSAMLESWECRFDVARNGREALDMMFKAGTKNDPYGLVILDMNMPDMDGASVGGKIRASETMGRPALVMLTSVGKKGDAERLKEIGFDAYLTKPIKQSQLYDCLVTVIGSCDGFGPGKKKDRFVTRHSLAESKVSNRRVLLVEDNVFNQMVAQEMLGKLGFAVEIANNGRVAVERLGRERFDLVFMDMQMPEMDGIEATGVIRDSSSNVLQHDVPIIAMTANAMKGDREACLNAGMDDYVAKPIKRVALEEAIARVPEKSTKVKTITPDSGNETFVSITTDEPEDNKSDSDQKYQDSGIDSDADAGTDKDIFDPNALLERLSGDEDLMKTILAAFVEDVARQIHILNQKLDTSDREAAQRQAHSIKGAAGNAGAPALQDMALAMENHLKASEINEAMSLFPILNAQFDKLVETLKAKELFDG